MLIILFLLLFAWPSSHILEIDNTKDGKSILQVSVKPKDHFSLEYVHSVQLSPVKDVFEISQNYQIFLISTSFSDHGAGLPYSIPQNSIFLFQDGKFGIYGIHSMIPEIYLRVSRNYGNIFNFGYQWINLSDRFGDSLLHIHLRKCNRLKLWRILHAR